MFRVSMCLVAAILSIAITTNPDAKHRHASSRVIDANGNSVMVTVKTAYGFNITVHPAYASKFQKFFALLKERGYKVRARKGLVVLAQNPIALLSVIVSIALMFTLGTIYDHLG